MLFIKIFGRFTCLPRYVLLMNIFFHSDIIGISAKGRALRGGVHRRGSGSFLGSFPNKYSANAFWPCQPFDTLSGMTVATSFR